MNIAAIYKYQGQDRLVKIIQLPPVDQVKGWAYVVEANSGEILKVSLDNLIVIDNEYREG
jgi:hypothetical protein